MASTSAAAPGAWPEGKRDTGSHAPCPGPGPGSPYRCRLDLLSFTLSAVAGCAIVSAQRDVRGRGAWRSPVIGIDTPGCAQPSQVISYEGGGLAVPLRSAAIMDPRRQRG